MNKTLGLSLLAGAASAVLFLSALLGGGIGVLLIYLAPLPLMLAGLCFGVAHAALGALAGLVTVGLAGLPLVPMFGAMVAVSTLVVVRQSLLWRVLPDGKLDWYPPGKVLGWLTGFSLALLLVGTVILATQGNGIEATVKQQIGGFVGDALAGIPVEMREALVGLWSSVFPAVGACAWMAVAVLNGTLGQWLAVKAGRAIRPTPSYVDLVAPAWPAIALGIALMAAMATTGDVAYVAKNVAAALIMPQVLVGLTVVHGALGRRPHGGLLLVGFYALSLVLFGWAMVGVAGLGLMKDWIGRRPKSGPGQEEE